MSTTAPNPALRRKNLLTAWILVVASFSLAASIFIWRYSHNQPPIPQGGSYSATYQVQPQQPAESQ